MDYNKLLEGLINRDNIINSSSFWEVSNKISNELINIFPKYNKLNIEVNENTLKVNKFENEFEKNSEFTKKSNELNELKKSIIKIKGDIQNYHIDNLKLLEETKKINQEYENLKKNHDIFSFKKNELEKINLTLNNEIKNKLKELEIQKIEFDKKTEEYSKLYHEVDKSIDLLMRLKQREVDLRNELTFQTSSTKVDVTCCKVQLPKSKEKNSDLFLFNDGEEKNTTFDLNKSFKSESTAQKHNGSITYLSFASTQPFFASGSEDSTVNITRTDDYRRIAHLNEAKKSIMSIDFSPSDRFLLTASFDSVCRLYSIPEFKLISTNSENRDCVNDAIFLTDEKFVTCCRDQTIKLYDISSSVPISSFTSSSTPFSICPLQGESLVVTAHHDGKVRGWDLRSQGMPFEIKIHKKQVVQVLNKPGDTKIYTLSSDKTISVSDIKTKGIIGQVNIQQSGMPSDKMQMTFFENSAIIGGTSGDLYDYDLSTFKLKSNTKAHNVPLFCVSSKHSIGLLATGDKNGNVRFWNI